MYGRCTPGTPHILKKNVTYSISMRYKYNVETYRTFYIQYKDKLFAYLMRLTGDYQLSGDTMQESFTRLLSHYGPNEQSAALLFKIARNAVMDNARKTHHSCSAEDCREDEGHNPEAMVLVRETYQKVLTAMQQLDKAERDILSLAVSTDFSYREIADIVGISEANVRVRIHRARMNLRKKLQSGDDGR